MIIYMWGRKVERCRWIGDGNVRVAQSRSARFSTSVAQHWADPLVQSGAWRSSRTGAAMAAAAKATTAVMVNCILGEFDWLVGVGLVEKNWVCKKCLRM